jgi:hypothetical protein
MAKLVQVVPRPSFPLTHIVFKAGKQNTLYRLRTHPEPKYVSSSSRMALR